MLTPQGAYRTKLLVLAALIAALTVGLCVAGVLLVGNEWGPEGARLALGIALGGNAVWIGVAAIAIALYYRSLRYELYDDEVIVRVGIWTRSVKHVPFRTVTNLKVNQDPLDRLFGIGSLNIQTAGMSGTGGAEESLVGLPDVQVVYDQVAERLRRFRTALSPTQAEEDAPTSDREVLVAMLEELRGLRRDASRA